MLNGLPVVKKVPPVEGESEIDISLHNNAVTAFVEAKLNSDISPRTIYDPNRNQIIRNIDCLLDDTNNTVPIFWMLVRDLGSEKAYVQLARQYRTNPTKLIDHLPHREPSRVRQVADCISLVRWKDFIQIVPQHSLEDDLVLSVFRELCERVQ